MVESPNPPAANAAAFWDANKHKIHDASYWLAHPLCRFAANRRISGDPHEWPLDWFRRRYVPSPFRRAISWGCGMGALERNAARIQLALAIDAFDVSTASLADARRLLEEEGLTGVRYEIGDFNDPRIAHGTYDLVLFHASLHHVARLGRLFRRMALRLEPRAVVYVDEYVGPSRFHWTTAALAPAQALLDEAPRSAVLRPTIELPIEVDDPSEAVRSDEIPSFLEDFFEIDEWRPYGGQLADVIFPYLEPTWTRSPEGNAYVQRLMDEEDEQLRRDPSASHNLVAVGRLKPRWRSVSVIARQGIQGLRRRL